MSRDLRYALQFTADDKASSKVERLNKTVERGNKKISDGAKSNAQAVRISSEQIARWHGQTAKAVRINNEQIAKWHNQTNQAQERAAQRGLATSRRLYQDRERLGIRSEERIRREIALTEAAYRRLAQSGRLSGQEQARAYQQMQQRVSSLRQELVATTKQQSAFARGASVVGRSIGAYQQLAGAVIGAGYVLAQPINRTASYERRLAYMANTAYAGKGYDAKVAGRQILQNAVAEATKYGGSREEAADALKEVIGSGAVKTQTGMNILPSLQKAAIATDSSTVDIAKIAVAAIRNFGIQEKEIPITLDIAAASGDFGGFEIKDMAKGLPELMSAANQLGMSGTEDFKSLVMYAQSSLISAGSADAAITNSKNLLLKLNAPDIVKRAANIEISPGKSIDLTKSLMEGRAKGMDPVEVFAGIVNRVMSNNKDYKELSKKIASAEFDSPEQRRLMTSQMALLEGSVISELIPDQQALLALVGIINNPEFNKSKLANAEGVIDENQRVIADTASNKIEKLNNERENAEYEAYQKLTASVGDAALKIADYAAQYPNLTQFMIVAKDALNALAGAAFLAAAAAKLGGFSLPFPGKGGNSPKPPRQPSGQSVQSAGSSRLASGMVIGAPVVFGAMDAYGVSKSNLSSDEKETAYTDIAVSTAAQAGGGWLGLKGGAALGAPLGPWGAALGGGIGAVVGSTTMDWVATELKEAVRAWNEKSPEELAQEQLEREKKQFAPRLGGSDDMPSLLSLLNAPSATEQLTPDQLSGILQHVVETGVQSAVEKARQVPQELKITTTVDVKNGNITAEVNAANSREARRN